MRRIFPTIGEYNQTIQNEGSLSLRTQSDLSFIPSKISPIKVFLFGSGSYAVVFKAIQYGKTYAIRCFLSTEQENIIRYESICNYLKTFSADWKVDCEFIDNEIEVKNQLYPILKMEWVDGELINDFITKNLHNNDTLSKLQKQLVEISTSLERHSVGHGDLQCGNMFIQTTPAGFQIKLIDYDGMYIPQFNSTKNLEKGRSEFQHPERSIYDFSPKIDRFSIWVMLTALEALKHNKSLWTEVMQGGFNTLDNLLFSSSDFSNPYNSRLFSSLKSINSETLNIYVNKLIQFCASDIDSIEKPFLVNASYTSIPVDEDIKNTASEKAPLKDELFITSSPIGANVLTTNFRILGKTPLYHNKAELLGKEIIVSSNNGDYKKFIVSDSDTVINVFFCPDGTNPEANENNTKKSDDSKSIEFDLIEEEPIIIKSKSKQKPPRKKKDYILPISFIVILIFITFLYYSAPIMEGINDLELTERNSNQEQILTNNPQSGSFNQPNSIQYQRSIKASEEYRYLSRVSNIERIKRFLKAEDNSDWEVLSYLFSNNVERYWNLENPTFDKLYTTYQYNWNNTRYRKNEIIEIKKISENHYKVSINFYFSNNSDTNQKVKYSELLFKFDDDGFIKYTNEFPVNLKDKNNYSEGYYIQRIKNLYNLFTLTVDKNEQEDYYELLDEYYIFYAPQLDKYYDIVGKTTPLYIYNEQIRFNEHYPSRKLNVSNFRLVNDDPYYTKFTFNSNYSLVDKSGKKFNGTFIETIAFNRSGKIIEHYME
jgi:hypothetical protein